MSGKVLLDTNAIIYALNGKSVLPSADYLVSIITEIELLSYSKLSEKDKQNIENLLNNFEILNLCEKTKKITIDIRKKYGIKLPDSIICATAMAHSAILISNDIQLAKIKGLNAVSLETFVVHSSNKLDKIL